MAFKFAVALFALIAVASSSPCCGKCGLSCPPPSIPCAEPQPAVNQKQDISYSLPIPKKISLGNHCTCQRYTVKPTLVDCAPPPAPAPAVYAPAPAPAPVIYAAAPAPAPLVYAAAPAPAPVVYAAAPAPAAPATKIVYNAPADPAPAVFAPAPAPAAPLYFAPAPAPAPAAPLYFAPAPVPAPAAPLYFAPAPAPAPACKPAAASLSKLVASLPNLSGCQ